MMKSRVIMYKLLTGNDPFCDINDTEYDEDERWSERAKYMLEQMEARRQNAKSGKPDVFIDDLNEIESKNGMTEVLAEQKQSCLILTLAKRLLLKMLQWDADDRPDAQQALNHEVCSFIAIAIEPIIAHHLAVVQGKARGWIFQQQASCVTFTDRLSDNKGEAQA